MCGYRHVTCLAARAGGRAAGCCLTTRSHHKKRRIIESGYKRISLLARVLVDIFNLHFDILFIFSPTKSSVDSVVDGRYVPGGNEILTTLSHALAIFHSWPESYPYLCTCEHVIYGIRHTRSINIISERHKYGPNS